MDINRRKSHLVLYKFSTFVFCCVLLQPCFVKAKSIDTDCSTSCESKECILQANMLIKHMKPDVDPCQDFYSFACGGYLDRFGEDDTRSTYDDTWNSLLILIKDLIEHLQPDNGSVSEKLKTTFETCMSKESEIKAIEDAFDFLSHVGISNWPNLDPNFRFTELSETLGMLAVYGEFAFITFQPSPYEEKNAPSHLPPALILPDKYLLDSKLKASDIKNTILKILSYFGIDAEESESMWETFKSIEDYGMKLQNEEVVDHTNCKGSSSLTYTKVNCTQEVQCSMKFLCELWKSAVKTGDLSRYYLDDMVHISCRWGHYHYIENVFRHLSNMSHRSLANYLALRFFSSHLDDLNLYFHLVKKSHSKLKDSSHKSTESISRLDYCLGWIIKSMHLALGYEYTMKIMKEPIQKNFLARDDTDVINTKLKINRCLKSCMMFDAILYDVLNIIQDYVQELAHNIDHQNWMKEEVKFYLKRQLQRLDIGFKNTMKNLKNGENVTNYYRQFQPVKGSFLKNILEYTKTSVVTKKEKSNFNSFYSSSDSFNMDFGLSLFLPPTYSYGLPKMLNYASLGWVIGHELSHNLKLFFDLVHLDAEMENNLKNRIECYTKQFSHFIMEKTGKGLNSKETEEEIIADNIGWILTEMIIKKFNDSTDNVNLPGMEYSPLQIMYISFAQDSCAALSKEVENEFYVSKPHNLQKLRVLSILQNSKIFSETFNCSSDAYMNPSNKCIFFE